MCSVCISEQTAITSLYINWLVFKAETLCVYCAVRTGYLKAIQFTPSPKGVKRREKVTRGSSYTYTECFNPLLHQTAHTEFPEMW